MYTGASQFALVGVLAGGGSPFAGLLAALLLGLRNAFYGVPVTRILRPAGSRRLWTAHFVVDAAARSAAPMTSTWATILAASLGCYALKLAGISLPQPVLNHPRVQQIAGLLPVAMLTALVVTDLFDANGRYTADWHTLAGVGAGALALRSGRSLVVVFLLAIATTALTRLIS